MYCWGSLLASQAPCDITVGGASCPLQLARSMSLLHGVTGVTSSKCHVSGINCRGSPELVRQQNGVIDVSWFLMKGGPCFVCR